MSNRVGFALASGLLLLAAVLRLWHLGSLPQGLHRAEINNIRISEAIRSGNITVFYNLEPLGESGGQEGLYNTLLTASTAVFGKGLLSFRLLSTISSMVMLALVYALATRLYGPLAGVSAMALLVLGFWPLLLARTIGPETMLPLLVAGVLLTLARALPVYYQAPDSEPGTLPFAILGVLLGLGFYLHPAHFLLTLAVMIFLAYMLLSPEPLSLRTLSYIGFAILVMIIVAMPYLISSIRLPELAGASRVFGDYRIADKAPLQAMLESLGGLMFRGDQNPTHNLPGRPMMDLVSGLLMIIGLLTALMQWRRPRFTLPLLALLILLPIAALRSQTPDFSAFAALLPVLALFFGLGVTSLSNTLPRQTRPVLSLGLLVLLVFNAVWLSRDFLQIWPEKPAVYTAYNGRLGQLAQYIDHSAGRLPTLVCASGLNQTHPQPELTPTQLMLLMLNRPGDSLRFADCGSALVFANGGDRQQVILTDRHAIDAVHPYLRDWLMHGEVLNSAVVPPDTVIILDVAEAIGDTVGRFTTTAPVTYSPEVPEASTVRFPPIAFGGNLTFLGYEPENNRNQRPGDTISVISYWRVDGPLPPDTRLFNHVLSDPAAIIAQTDTIGVVPGHLQPRDIFVQVTFISLPRSTPAGAYQVSIGAYQDLDNARLAVLEDGEERGTRLFLTARRMTID